MLYVLHKYISDVSTNLGVPSKEEILHCRQIWSRFFSFFKGTRPKRGGGTSAKFAENPDVVVRLIQYDLCILLCYVHANVGVSE